MLYSRTKKIRTKVSKPYLRVNLRWSKEGLGHWTFKFCFAIRCFKKFGGLKKNLELVVLTTIPMYKLSLFYLQMWG